MYQRQVFNRYLTEKEEAQLFQTIRKFGSVLARRDYAWMKLARFTGMRVSALSGFTVGDAILSIQEKRICVRAEINKGHNDSSTYATKPARKQLKTLLKIHKEMGHPLTPGDPLIMSRNHRQMSVRTFQASMAAWVKKAELEVNPTPHWWRHTFAKRMAERSVSKNPMGVVQHALGHSDIRSTAIYLFPDRCELEAAMEAAC